MWPVAAALLCLGAVISARLSLKAHTWPEIGYGVFTGSLSCALVFIGVMFWQQGKLF